VLQSFKISLSVPEYCIAGMFGMVNVWRITELKETGKIKFGELIDFIHKDGIYKLNFVLDKVWRPRTIHQTFPLPNIPAIQYEICQVKCQHYPYI